MCSQRTSQSLRLVGCLGSTYYPGGTPPGWVHHGPASGTPSRWHTTGVGSSWPGQWHTTGVGSSRPGGVPLQGVCHNIHSGMPPRLGLCLSVSLSYRQTPSQRLYISGIVFVDRYKTGGGQRSPALGACCILCVL